MARPDQCAVDSSDLCFQNPRAIYPDLSLVQRIQPIAKAGTASQKSRTSQYPTYSGGAFSSGPRPAGCLPRRRADDERGKWRDSGLNGACRRCVTGVRSGPAGTGGRRAARRGRAASPARGAAWVCTPARRLTHRRRARSEPPPTAGATRPGGGPAGICIGGPTPAGMQVTAGRGRPGGGQVCRRRGWKPSGASTTAAAHPALSIAHLAPPPSEGPAAALPRTVGPAPATADPVAPRALVASPAQTDRPPQVLKRPSGVPPPGHPKARWSNSQRATLESVDDWPLATTPF